MKRKVIREKKEELSLYSLLDGETFDGAIKNLEEEKKYWRELYPYAIEFYLDISTHTYEDGTRCYLMVERHETDAEFEKRAAEQVEYKRKQEEDALKILESSEELEREMYEKLRAKYGEQK